MIEYPATVLVGVGAIVAALIAAAASFVSMISSKEEKVSEFRQEWINSIREETSEFLALLKIVAASDKIDVTNVEYKNLTDKYNRILLRLNPKKDNVLAEKIKKAYKDLYTDNPRQALIENHCESLVADSQVMLKTEWERVKKGEKIYQYTKFLPVVLIVFVIGIGYVTVSGKLPFKVECMESDKPK